MKRLFTALFAFTVMAVGLIAQEAPKKYGIKSGTVKAVTEVMGQKAEGISYFDNYGALEAGKSQANGMEVLTITRDGKTYMVVPSVKQVREIPAQESVNYLNLTDDVIEKYKIKEIGKDVVAGKDCIKYSMEVSQMGQTAKLTVSVWNGYAMKTVSSAMGMVITAVVTEFKEGEVDPSLFEIPSFQ